MPARISSSWRLESFPTSSVNNSRSRVMIWEAFATESLPGPDPVGSGRLAQYTCPWAITIQRLQVYVSPRQKRLDRSTCPSPRRLDSSPQSQRQDRDARRIRSRLPYKPGFVTSSVDGITARHHGKSCREWTSLSSYRTYNQATVRVQTYSAVRVVK